MFVNIVSPLVWFCVGLVGFYGVSLAVEYYRTHTDQEYLYRAVRPFLVQAVFFAAKASEVSLEEIGKELRGADKKAIANAAYAMLPDKIGGLPLKKLISEQLFDSYVEKTYQELIVLFDKNKATLLAEQQELLASLSNPG